MIKLIMGVSMMAALATTGPVAPDSQPVSYREVAPPALQGGPGFRVRADPSVPLNADTGWAARLNENATVRVDQPFRVRIEVEQAGPDPRQERLGLQYRKAGGDWSPVEAHDFPYPSREIEIDFADVPTEVLPGNWRIVGGHGSNLAIVADGGSKVMQARATDGDLIGLYSPPWALEAFSFSAEYRLPLDGDGRFAIVFGYVDAANHWRAHVDAGSGTVGISHVVDGLETLMARKSAGPARGVWQEIEVKVEDGLLDVDFADGALQVTIPVVDPIPVSALGFFLPPAGQVDFRGFVVEGPPSSPTMSIVSTPAYAQGDSTTDLLKGAASPFAPGTGVSLSDVLSSSIAQGGSHSEFEWPLVIRRFADRAILSESGEVFELRVIGGDGTPIPGGATPSLTLHVPDFHLGGTFVETPGRIGPWQTSNGDLYFIMEPTESDNLFMMVKSSDGGRSWREVDGNNRPATGDLESVDARLVDGTIHMIHQISGSTFHHAFRTSDHPTHPDSWALTDELATKVIARVQMATLVVRSDGSMVAFHLGNTIGYAVRSPAGVWGQEHVIGGNDGLARMAGPQAVLGAQDEVHLGYTREDGTIWHRKLLLDGTLTEPSLLASGADTTEAGYGAVLPLVYIPETDTTVLVYQQADGTLWERRVTGDRLPSAAVQVTSRPVMRSAIDSQQPAADAVADGSTVRVLFIDAAEGNIYSTDDAGGWQPPRLEVNDIDGGWVRGGVYRRADGARVLGFAYDAGSRGGAGFIRFAETRVD